jgi:hypothetical protein
MSELDSSYSAAAPASAEAEKDDSVVVSIRDRGGNNKTSIPFRPLSQVLSETPAEPKWIFEDYIAPFAVTLLAGRPKVGKSTWLFALMAALTTGEHFLARQTRECGILLLPRNGQTRSARRRAASR